MNRRQTLALAESRRLGRVLEDLLSQAAEIGKALKRTDENLEAVINATAAAYTRRFNLEHQLGDLVPQRRSAILMSRFLKQR
jgi:hypothetical protein